MLEGFGGPEVLKIGEAETPAPQRGQVLIRVAATTVNLRQAAPLYEDAPLPPAYDSTAVPDTTAGNEESGDGE